jgi:radical SAM superfamily enzyme YgiQ (UPF0313 family)
MVTEKKIIALITTNQIDIGIRTLSSVLQNTGFKTILVNLSSSSSYHPYRYPDVVKEALLPIISPSAFVGISTTDMFFPRTQDLATWIKAKFGAKVVLGGIHAQLYPDDCISTPGVDAVCIGEGLRTVNSLLKSKSWDTLVIDDFWVKGNNGGILKGRLLPVLTTREMRELPIPDYSYDSYWLLDEKTNVINPMNGNGGCFNIDQHQVGHPNSFVASFMWGCVNQCTFCNITALFEKWQQRCPENKRFRIKPNDIVVRELEVIKENNPKMKFMCIMDNDFTLRSLRDIKEFFSFFRNHIAVPVYLMVSPNTLNEKKLMVMIDGGLKEINMGIESNEKTNRLLYKRPISDAAVLNAARMINRYIDQVYPFYDFLIFNPLESNDLLLKTLNLIRKLPLPFDVIPHYLTLGPEILLYKRYIGAGHGLLDETITMTMSDFHTFSFEKYQDWPTFYLNLLLEWIGGPHNSVNYGRLPRTIGDFSRKPAFAAFLRKNDLFPPDSTDTLEFLTSRPIMDILVKDFETLREITLSLDSLVFTNQQLKQWGDNEKNGIRRDA